MILSLIAAWLTVGSHQTNPPGTMVAPSQAAFYSATGGTAVVEVRNYQGQLVQLVDAAGVPWPNATVTLPAATPVGLGWLLTQTKPDGTNALSAVAASQSSFVIKMNCSATESPVGTYDSSTGAGSGIAAGYPAPTAASPTAFAAGISYTIAPGSVITAAAASGTSAVATVPAGSVWALPPSGWTASTDWTVSNGLPPSPKYLWMNLAPGATATLKVDGGGQIGVQMLYVAGTLLQLPPGITKIYAVGNGSTGASIAFVVG